MAVDVIIPLSVSREKAGMYLVNKHPVIPSFILLCFIIVEAHP
jgi:hypothetical protein